MLLFLILYLLIINRRKLQFLHSLHSSLTAIQELNFRAIKRYGWKLQARKRRQRRVQRARHQGPRNQGDITRIDLYDRTGLYPDQFQDLFDALQHTLQLPRRVTRHKKATSTTLSPHFRLLLALDYLKNGPKYKRFVPIYNISLSQVAKEVYHILPKVCAYLSTQDLIKPTSPFAFHSFEGVVGMSLPPPPPLHLFFLSSFHTKIITTSFIN